MKASNGLEDQMARLRSEWPVGSLVSGVMGRIGAVAAATSPAPAEEDRRRGRGRWFAGLAASGLAAGLLLAWIMLAGRPTTLLAAVRDGLQKSRSAYLVFTSSVSGSDGHRVEMWYRRDEGLRVEAPDRVIVEDGTHQWSWAIGAAAAPNAGDRVVLRQRSPGFWTTQLPGMLALPDVPGAWRKARAPELDRELPDGTRARGFEVTLPGAGERGLVLAEAGDEGRIREIRVQARDGGGAWRDARAIRIDYDVPVPPERIALRLPAGSRVVDRDAAFEGRYPLERALSRVERGGLLFAVHDIQPLRDREGVYVVSSVRGTPEYLKRYPPRRRPINPEVVMLDVAYQPMGNMMEGTKYDRIVLGTANRGGVDYSWWVIVPRRFYEVKEGRRVYLPEGDVSAMPGEPGRLDPSPGRVNVPLRATCWSERLRDEREGQREVSIWVEMAVPADRPPTTLDEVARRARGDLLLMGVGGVGRLLGVAAGTKAEGGALRPISSFDPESIEDAEFLAAVRRGLDDLRRCDQVGSIGPEDGLPWLGGGRGGDEPKP